MAWFAIPGITCELVSSVMAMGACPRCSWTNLPLKPLPKLAFLVKGDCATLLYPFQTLQLVS